MEPNTGSPRTPHNAKANQNFTDKIYFKNIKSREAMLRLLKKKHLESWKNICLLIYIMTDILQISEPK